MLTLTLTPDRLNEVQPGDRLVGLNGSALSRPLTVVGALAELPGGVQAIALRTPHGTPANLYPDTHVDRGVTVERDEPTAVQPRRPAVRTFHGVRFASDGTGSWWTGDRRYEIRKGFGGLTECEADHPVRITRALAEHAHENRDTGWAQPILEAIRAGRRGFICEGGSEHSYDEWEVWDHQLSDYANGGRLNHAESFRDAADSLALFLAA